MTLPADIPQKPYYRIGEVARFLGLETHVLRYWESEFPQLKPVRAASKQRLYRLEDLEKLFEIKELVHEKRYTIAGARQLLDQQQDSPIPETEPPPDASMEQQPAPATEQLSLAMGPAAMPDSMREEVVAELKDILRILD